MNFLTVSTLLCFHSTLTLTLSADLTPVGRYWLEGDSDSYIYKVGWPLSGVGFDTEEENTKFQLDIWLPQPNWYDVWAKSADGVRMGVFVNNDLVEDFLVTPFDSEKERKFEISKKGSSVRILRLSEELYTSGVGNAVNIANLNSDSPIGQLSTSPTKVLFVGDSDTAGFGIHSHPGDPNCLRPYMQWSSINDASLSWASQLGNLMSSTFDITAISGVGVDSAYGNDPWNVYMDRALPFVEGMNWDYSKDEKDMVIILLGPNDCGASNFNKCPRDFVDNYVALLEHYAEVYPGSSIISVIGGSSSGENDAIKSAIASASDQFDHPVITVSAEVWKHANSKTDWNGCMGHYNQYGHNAVAVDVYDQMMDMGILKV